MPEPQTLLIVVAPADSGSPAAMAAWRAEVGRQYAAHDHFIDLRGRQLALFDGGGNRGSAESGGGNAIERAQERTDGSALGGGDDDLGHCDVSVQRAIERW